MTTTTTQFAGFPALKLENEHTCLVVVPELGGKITSIRSKISGTEFLWQNPTREYHVPIYADDFAKYDGSGFDECFPSIGACPYPGGPWDGINIPDHGELWCTPWRHEILDQHTLYLHAYGVRFPYHFEKWISLDDDAPQYTLRYRLTNLSPFPFASLWSAHPLFAVQTGTRVLIPGTPPMRLTHASGNRVGGPLLQERQWPWVEGPDGAPLDYSLIGVPNIGANDKVYVNTPPEGWCALFQPHSGEFVAVALSASETPFIGVCANHGGWPPSGEPAFWVAIEPCTGWPDRLDEVAPRNHVTVDAWGSIEWSLGLQFGHAPTADAVGEIVEHTTLSIRQ